MSRPFVLCFVALTVVVANSSSVFGQLQIGMESERSTYLLYEPIVFSLTLTNTTGSPLALSDHPVSGRPWLSFQIFRADGSKVMPVPGTSVPAQVLKPGESRIIDVNITPLYRIRATGPYDIRAVVTLAGRQSFQTGRLRFIVGKGEEFWTINRQVNGKERKYSLLRFLERKDSTLYVRVEEPDHNTVYATQRLGSVVGYTKPQIQFDASGNLHILHVNTSQLYRYTELGLDGQILHQEDRQVTNSVPRLMAGQDGRIVLAGGVDIRSKPQRRKLSEDQAGL